MCAAGTWAAVHCLCTACHMCNNLSEVCFSGDTDDGECAAALWAAVQRLTREQLALGLLQLLADLEAQASKARILIPATSTR